MSFIMRGPMISKFTIYFKRDNSRVRRKRGYGYCSRFVSPELLDLSNVAVPKYGETKNSHIWSRTYIFQTIIFGIHIIFFSGVPNLKVF